MHRHMHSHTPQLQTSQQSCPCCSNFAIAQNIAEPPRGCGPAANQFPTNNNDPQRKIQNRKQLIKTCFISVFLYNERPLVFLSVHWGRLKKGAAPERKRESLTVIDTGPRYAACWWTFINGATARLENTAHTNVHTHTHMHRSDVEHMSSTSTFTRTHTHTRSQASWKTAGLFYPLLFSVRSWVTAIAYQRHTLAQTGSGFISPAALCSGALAAHLPVSPPSERSGALCTRTWAAAGGGYGAEIRPGES